MSAKAGAESVASIVLAAGASRRMGRAKPLLPAREGGTLLAQAVAPHLAAGIGRVVVVLGCDAERVRAEAGMPVGDPRLAVVVNERWEDGMSSSLRAGLLACEGFEAVLVALGDEPGATVERIRAVASAWAPGVPMVVPMLSSGRAAHPVLFGRCLWEELRALEGDRGARDVVRRHFSEAARVAVAPLADVDTEDDYRDYIEGRPPRADAGMEPPPRNRGEGMDDDRRSRSRAPLKIILTAILLVSALWLAELYMDPTWQKIRSFVLGYFLGTFIMEWVHQRASRDVTAPS